MTKYRVSVPYILWHHLEIEADEYGDVYDKIYESDTPYNGGFGQSVNLSHSHKQSLEICDQPYESSHIDIDIEEIKE